MFRLALKDATQFIGVLSGLAALVYGGTFIAKPEGLYMKQIARLQEVTMINAYHREKGRK